MPYSGPGDKSLPSNVKKMPTKKKKQWVAVWNNTYSSCIKDGGDTKTCETKAFKYANGVVKQTTSLTARQRSDHAKSARTLIKQAWADLVSAIQSDLNSDSQTIERAVGFSQMREQLWDGLETSPQTQEDGMAWPIDIFYDGGDIFAIVAQKGKFYRIPLTITDTEMTLGEWTQVAQVFEPVKQSLRVYRQADGRYRFVGIAATSVLNRVAQIDSRDLFDSFIEDTADTGIWPRMDFYHQGRTNEAAWEFGTVDYHVREGFCYIVSGLLDSDHPLTEATVRAFNESPDTWGFSIEFYAFGEPEKVLVNPEVRIPVYKKGRIVRVSLVREKDAASLFTRVGNITEEKIRMKRDTTEALAELFGTDEAAKKFLEQFGLDVDEVNRTVTDEKLVARSSQGSDQGNESEDAVEDEETETEDEEKSEETSLLELDETAMAELGRQVFSSPEFKLIAQSLIKIHSQLEEMATARAADAKAIADLQAANVNSAKRLAQVEKSETVKKQEYRQDIPAQATRKATFRPREAYSEDEDGEEDMAEKAQRTLAKLPTRY